MISDGEYEIPENCIGHIVIINPEEHKALQASFNLRDQIIIGRKDLNFAQKNSPKQKDGPHDG